MPVGYLFLSEAPAKKHGVSFFGVLGGEVDETRVEILDLNAGRLELGDEARDVGRSLRSPLLELADAIRVETAAVARDASLDVLEPSGHVHEALAGLDEALDQGPDRLERRVRLILREELHPAMLNSAVA
jgi:hypothetical protein